MTPVYSSSAARRVTRQRLAHADLFDGAVKLATYSRDGPGLDYAVNRYYSAGRDWGPITPSPRT
jgi:hypothetical protein